VGTRGVGKYAEDARYMDDGEEEDSGFLSEDRLVEIALQLSLLEK